MNEDPREITGIHVAGLYQLTESGVDSLPPVLVPADAVDRLMASGSWGRGRLHGLRVIPRPQWWPERWRVLAEPPGSAAD